MNNADQPLKDIRSTGDEAQRWLDELESDPVSQAEESLQKQPIAEPHTNLESVPGANQAHPALVLLILAILLSPLILLVVNQSRIGGRSSLSPSSAYLPYKASCGSTTSASGYWWPVLGRADRSLLSTVRSRYCGDAYINKEGALQVASFGSWEEADAFRSRIQEATKSSFRVGESRLTNR